MKPEIAKAIQAVETAKARLESLRANCVHRIVPDNPEDPESSDGVCDDCGKTTGSWFCPKNPPTHVCEYTNGEWCIHCGNPEERK